MKPKTKNLVFGVGLNDSDYIVTKHEAVDYVDGKIKQKLAWFCPYYRVWVSMLQRCYDTKFQERQPASKGCTVADEWLTFSVFKNWMKQQDWEGKQLDKDLLFEGNKIYNPETCVFLTRMASNFTLDRGNDRGKWLTGASWDKNAKKFRAMCSNPFTKKYEYLGLFTIEQEAHKAWLKKKLELAHLLAAEQTDPRAAKALIGRYSK